ncbi:MAG TPA: hypothetical protein VLX29_08460 [Nitrospirota bacterium]|nr:hypothetical protein [Nitrospirota bacterium]
MNETEARNRFLSAAQGINRTSLAVTLEEAKNNFRKAAADFDTRLGFDGVKLTWGLLTRFVNPTTIQSWLLPFITNLVHLGSKSIDMVLSLLTHKEKVTRPAKKRRH